MTDLVPIRIRTEDEYRDVKARRDLVAASLRGTENLPPGAMPTEVRVGLEQFLARLNRQVHEYETAKAREVVFGMPQ